MERETANYDDDDGRVICNMNVEGMPWYNRRIRSQKGTASDQPKGEQLTPAEARLYTWYSILAGLLIALVFSGVWVLFILFCTEVWFK